MNQTVLDQMKKMAAQENKRLRQVMGNVLTHEQWMKSKEGAARGGANSHLNGRKAGKNGPRKQSESA